VLTAEQQDLWERMGMDDVGPTKGQTLDQARNLAIDSFLHICRLDGIPEPSEVVLRASFSSRSA
jgi:hypothetical protein